MTAAGLPSVGQSVRDTTLQQEGAAGLPPDSAGTPRSESGGSQGGSSNPSSSTPLRGLDLDRAAFPLLTSGKSLTATARRLKVPRQTISDAAGRMVRAGYLREVHPGANPKLFARGPRAVVMDRLMAPPDSERGARSALPPAARVHRQEFRWTIGSGPGKPVAWLRSWPLGKSGVICSELDRTWNGRTYTVRETRGPKLASLKLSCPPEWVMDRAELATLERTVLHEAAQLLRAFAEEHQYALEGQLTVVQAPEIGFLVGDAFPKFGRPGVPPMHVDDSGGETGGERELETTDVGLAQSIMDLPGFIGETRRKLSSVMEILRQLAEEAREVVGASERLAGIQAMQERVAVQLLSQQLGAATAQAAHPLPPSIPDERTGYA